MKIVTIALALLVLSGCERSGSLFPNSPSPSEAASPFPSTGTAPSPTPPAVPDTPLPTSGPKTPTCVGGWTRPAAGTPLEARPIAVIRKAVPVPGKPIVVDLRYFAGPESPPSEMGYLETVRRWYVKLSNADLTFQGRFLVEARDFGVGVVAVAPYDTSGFRSPDWSGFQYDETDADRKTYPGLPGAWSGIRYDFVRGGSGLDIPGLPRAVIGCIAES